ncbi:hypothetical protein Tco_0328686 [Tanacetum coccineum]
MKVEESLNVTFDESPPLTKLSPLVDDDVGEEEAIRKNTKLVNNNNNKEDESTEVEEIINIKESKNHLLDQVIGNLNQRTIVAMQEELNQFVANDVWELVPLPISQSIIGTKLVYRNKLDENGSGYHQKDKKPSQNDKTEHGMEKTVQNQGQSPKMTKSESILKNTVGCNLYPSNGPGKPNTRFGGNEATKKTQKALLKQQYENFNASSLESLDSIFNRLQKLVSRLAILGVVTSPEDLNVKFLRSLPAEWDTHVVVWMNNLILIRWV